MKKTLLPLFVSQSLRAVGVSLLSFFSAVYVYKQTSSFLAVFAFFLLFYLLKITGTCLAEDFALKIGLKKQVAAGYILTAFSLFAFAASKENPEFLLLAAIFWGLSAGLFWFGRHGLLIKIGEEDKFGQTVGTFGAGENLLLLATPALGGFLIAKFGYQALFLAALVFIFFALLALRKLKEEKTHRETGLKEVLRLLWEHKRTALTYASSGLLDSIYSQALILYVFLAVKKELGMGAFFSLSMILVALAHYFTGKLIDTRGKKEFLVFGSLVNSFVWLGRFLAGNYQTLFVWDVLGRIAGGMIGYPLEVLSYQKAIDGGSTGRAILFREIAIGGGAILGTLFLIILAVFGLSLKFAFLPAVLFSAVRLAIIKGGRVLGEK